MAHGSALHGTNLAELGEAAGGMDYAAVAAAIRRFGIKLAVSRALQIQFEDILNRIEKLQIKTPSTQRSPHGHC